MGALCSYGITISWRVRSFAGWQELLFNKSPDAFFLAGSVRNRKNAAVSLLEYRKEQNSNDRGGVVKCGCSDFSNCSAACLKWQKVPVQNGAHG